MCEPVLKMLNNNTREPVGFSFNLKVSKTPGRREAVKGYGTPLNPSRNMLHQEICSNIFFAPNLMTTFFSYVSEDYRRNKIIEKKNPFFLEYSETYKKKKIRAKKSCIYIYISA